MMPRRGVLTKVGTTAVNVTAPLRPGGVSLFLCLFKLVQMPNGQRMARNIINSNYLHDSLAGPCNASAPTQVAQVPFHLHIPAMIPAGLRPGRPGMISAKKIPGH